MALDRVILETSAGALLGGLKWAPLVGKPGRVALNQARAMHDGVSHAVLLAGAEVASYGLFGRRVSEEGEALPRQMVSAAAAFALRVGAQEPDAALVLHLADPNDGAAERCYVVVLHNGVPVADEITSKTDALNLIGSTARVYADDDVSFPRCEPADLEWLAQGAGKAARIQAIPLDPWPLLVGGLVVLALAAGWMGMKRYQRIQEERRIAAEAARADPVPKYLGALEAQSPQMASQREGIARMADRLFALPVAVPGWRLQTAECLAREQVCVAQWRRVGGTFVDLERALPGQTLQPVLAAQTGLAELDLAQTRQSVTVERASLLSDAQRLPTLRQVHDRFGPQLQVWKTAKLGVDLRAPRLWPSVPEVPAGFTHARALQAGDFLVRDVPGPFVHELIREAPAPMSWERLRLVVEDNPDPLGRLKFELSGSLYVSNPSL